MVLGVNWSVVQRLKPVIMFSFGILCGALLQNIVAQSSSSVAFRETPHPFKLSSVRAVGVSHNPEIKKQVLAGYFDMPHITQIAKSSLKPGQIASENWHKDMVEMFIFTSGQGVLTLDQRNYSVEMGSIALIYPPTKHTIYNIATSTLELLTIASVP